METDLIDPFPGSPGGNAFDTSSTGIWVSRTSKGISSLWDGEKWKSDGEDWNAVAQQKELFF